MPLPNGSLRDRLIKTLRLANQGVGGERENAEVILEKLLRMHGLSRADLDEIDAPVRETTWYAVQRDERNIFSGLVHSLFGEDRSIWIHTKNAATKATQRGVDLSAAEKATFSVAWDVYRSHWKTAREDFLIAFLRKHKLYDTTNIESRDWDELTEDEQAAHRRRQALTNALPDVDKPGRRLRDGSAD